MRRFHKIGIALIVILAVAVAATRLEIPMNRLPTPGNIDDEKSKTEELQRELAILKKKQAKYKKQRRILKAQAGAFWPASSDKNPKVLVQNEFKKLAQNAQVTLDSMGGIQVNEASELVREVMFSIQLNTSMQEFSKLLAQMAQSSHHFYWDRCTIRPDKRKDPRNVRISGKLKTFVLTPEATRFIFEKEQVPSS